MTLVRYEGPPDSYNHDVAVALAATRVDVDVTVEDTREAPTPHGTVTVTDSPAVTGMLEPGKVYDLPADLATQLVETSAHFHRVTDYSKLTKKQLLDVAAEHGIEGRSKMTADELVAALRGSRSSSSSASSGDAGNEEAAGADAGAATAAGSTTTGAAAGATAGIAGAPSTAATGGTE